VFFKKIFITISIKKKKTACKRVFLSSKQQSNHDDYCRQANPPFAYLRCSCIEAVLVGI